jgi:putative endopeptidase
MIRKYLQIGTSCFFIVSCSTAQKEITTIKEKPVPTEAVKQAEPTVSKSINTSYLDLNIRPQDDFFLFSNGKWVKENPVPPSESRWGSFNELDKSNKQKLTEILKFAVANSSKKGSQNQLLGDFYTSYTSMSKRNELGITPIQADLDKIKNIKSRQEIVSIIAESHKVGVSMFFSFGVGQDLKNVAKNISSIDQDGIGLPNCDYYLQADKATILDAYQKHIAASFMLLNYDEKAANEIAKSVVAFEKNLALSMMKPSELRVPENTYNLKSKKELDKAFGKFDFESYLAAVGSQSFDSIVVGQPKFIEKIASLLETAEMVQLKNYLLWSTVNAYAGLLTEEFVNLNFKFYGGVLSGKKEMKSLNDRAIDEITGLEIGELLGKAFVEKHFSQKSQDRVNSMVDNLLLVFKDRINNLEWMSKETKEQALVKLNSIGRKLGFPSKWEDFSALNINASTYLENMREMSRASHKKNLSELYKPIDKEKWGMPAHMVNAYYNPLLNEIAFPAGIMQAPFFDENAEDAVNYGAIGMVIGHEFTHGFDDMGSKFAADGSFINWWTENDLKLFEEKTALLGKTFSNFCPIDGHCVNPDLTMGENIADLGGLTLAYYAYTLTEEFKSGNLIDGYTPAQRFFIGYAQLWKINYTDAEMKNRIANDPHSPGMYRVNGPLMNCPEFFAAFDVKEGDKMRNSLLKLAKIW